MNSINIVGRIGKEPEVTQSQSGVAICRFNVAVNRRGQKDITDWFQCVAFKGAAENIQKYFSKGSMIGLSGEIQFGEFTNKEGINIKTTTLVVNNFSFCGSSNNSNSNNNQSSFTDDMTPVDDGDLPF
ncbi:MAG: single-stranded DNA-binding protein [Clostridium sp.]|uniref:single-stranded DNA-binding protein n=1 Tax=Clostridium sp. TaxID=1506 RepID=UPI003EE44C48